MMNYSLVSIWCSGVVMMALLAFIIRKAKLRAHNRIHSLKIISPWTGISLWPFKNPIVISYHLGKGLIRYISAMHQHPSCEIQEYTVYAIMKNDLTMIRYINDFTIDEYFQSWTIFARVVNQVKVIKSGHYLQQTLAWKKRIIHIMTVWHLGMIWE